MKKLKSAAPLAEELLRVEKELNDEIQKMDRAQRHPKVNWINWLYDCNRIKNAKAGDSQTETLSQYICLNFLKFKQEFEELDRFELIQNESVQNTGFYNILNRPKVSSISQKDSIHRNIFLRHGTNQEEKNIARLMKMKSRDCCFAFDSLGQVLNFEIPLGGEGRGKIDLVSYNGFDNIKKFYLLELKRPNSSESLLRCVLEIYTYFKTIANPKKMLADFGLPDDTKFVLAPLFFERRTDRRVKSSQFEEHLYLTDKANVSKTIWERRLFDLVRDDVCKTFKDPGFNHLEFILLKGCEVTDIMKRLNDESLYLPSCKRIQQ